MTKHVDDYWKKKSKPLEYKYAFGQRIPIHHDWVVKQTPQKDKDEKDKDSAKKEFNMAPIIEKVYDINGRATGETRLI